MNQIKTKRISNQIPDRNFAFNQSQRAQNQLKDLIDDLPYVNHTCSNLNSGFPQKQMQPPLGSQIIEDQPVFGDPEKSKIMPVFGGNWSRTKYDGGSLEIDTLQSTSALEYMLDPNYAERCHQCRAPGPGWIGKQGNSFDTYRPIVDTESELFNLNRVLTRDPNYQYLPFCPQCGGCDDGYPCGGGVTKGCNRCQPPLFHFPSCDLKFEYTRTSNPTMTLRETGINRFQPICLNPQDRNRWEHPGETGINYRMVVKDNHVPCLPYPLDPASALPIGGDIPCDLIFPTCSAYTAPLNNYRLNSEGPNFSGNGLGFF
jgi:hypothetical protein